MLIKLLNRHRPHLFWEYDCPLFRTDRLRLRPGPPSVSKFSRIGPEKRAASPVYYAPIPCGMLGKWECTLYARDYPSLAVSVFMRNCSICSPKTAIKAGGICTESYQP